MATFYTTLSAYYDEIFPAREKDLAFIASLLDGRASVLDIGCGTGNKTALLARGRRAVGFDLDAGMIARAETAHAAPGLEFRVLDMRSMASAFPPASFDAAVCLGNTLAHLAGGDDLPSFCRDLRTVLAPGGLFVGQILNYDRIVSQHVDALPLIDTPAVRFERRYERRDGQLRFVTRITDKHSGESFVNDIELRPLLRADLDAALTRAGFEVSAQYGDFAGGAFAAQSSFHLFVVSERRPRSE